MVERVQTVLLELSVSPVIPESGFTDDSPKRVRGGMKW
jgi:hypothetical protein